MQHFYTLLFSSMLAFSTSNVLAQTAPCTFTGGSVYIDNTTGPWMMNATVNGMSMYDYLWTDTNGLVISTANQTPFYTQWCVTIVDNISGCDTVICQDCTADSTALCMCTMIYMPVCGCDGVQYANSCLADCADVPWTPAIPNGQLGGGCRVHHHLGIVILDRVAMIQEQEQGHMLPWLFVRVIVRLHHLGIVTLCKDALIQERDKELTLLTMRVILFVL